MAVAAASAAALVAAGCQPVDAPPSRDAATDDAVASEAPADPGAPAEPGAPAANGVPQSLKDLRARLETVAPEWQAEAVVAEIHVSLADATWTQAVVTYVAPDAERLLLVDLDAAGMSQQRPTFSTLGLHPVSAAGVAEIPPFPEEAQDPQELAAVAAPMLEACGVDPIVSSVLYASGAPVAWDGERWREQPTWTAAVATQDGDTVHLDPATGEPVREGCA
jgi:hypothetical protein